MLWGVRTSYVGGWCNRFLHSSILVGEALAHVQAQAKGQCVPSNIGILNSPITNEGVSVEEKELFDMCWAIAKTYEKEPREIMKEALAMMHFVKERRECSRKERAR